MQFTMGSAISNSDHLKRKELIVRKPDFMTQDFGRTFWSVNVGELFERAAWYSFFTICAIYLPGRVDEGALGLTAKQAGNIIATVPFALYLFPMFAASFGERFGYKRVLLASYVILAVGYFTCSLATGYKSFFTYFMLVAIGAGLVTRMKTGEWQTTSS